MTDRKKWPDQKLPNKVWEKIGDISDQFFDGRDLTDRRRQLRTNLTNVLKHLKIESAADGENDAKPELQPVDIIPLLKSTDVYASNQMAEKRFQTIQQIQGAALKKRKAAEAGESSTSETLTRTLKNELRFESSTMVKVLPVRH